MCLSRGRFGIPFCFERKEGSRGNPKPAEELSCEQQPQIQIATCLTMHWRRPDSAALTRSARDIGAGGSALVVNPVIELDSPPKYSHPLYHKSAHPLILVVVSNAPFPAISPFFCPHL